MLAEFKRLNDDHITEDIIVGSADVKALHPSLNVDFTVEKVYEVFYNSEIYMLRVWTRRNWDSTWP